jgi:serine/threonine protein kinase
MVRSYTRRKKRGGAAPKLAGQGTYGCGFMPSLSCSYNTAERQNTFSKLMINNTGSNRSNVINEIDKIYKLRIIDPTFKYSLYPSVDEDISGNPNTFKVRNTTFKKCRPRQNNINKYQQEISKCKLIKQPINSSNYVILQSTYGGISLSDYIQQLKTEFNMSKLIDLLLSVENLFEGLVKFHNNNFYHMDIKSDNIVVSGSKTRFIDFGLSIDLKDENDKVYTSTYNQPYFAWPFELYFHNIDIRTVPKYKVAPIFNSFAKDALDYNIDSHLIAHNNYMNGGRYIYNGNIAYSILDSIKNEKYAYYFQKTDIYSMGLILNAILYKSMGIILFYKLDKDGNRMDIPAILVPNSRSFVEMDSPSSNMIPNIELIRTFIAKGGFDILLFANKLVSFDPRDRYSTIEAYTQYKLLCDNLRKNKAAIINLTPLPKNNQSIVSKVVNTVSSFFKQPSPPPPPMPPTAWMQPSKNHVAINITKNKKLNHIAIPVKQVQPARLPGKRNSKL